MYWRGVASDGAERYVDTLLVAPANALTRTFVAPGDTDLYDRWAGTAVDYVFIACYPTTAANTAPTTRCRAASSFPACSAAPKRRSCRRVRLDCR